MNFSIIFTTRKKSFVNLKLFKLRLFLNVISKLKSSTNLTIIYTTISYVVRKQTIFFKRNSIYNFSHLTIHFFSIFSFFQMKNEWILKEPNIPFTINMFYISNHLTWEKFCDSMLQNLTSNTKVERGFFFLS